MMPAIASGLASSAIIRMSAVDGDGLPVEQQQALAGQRHAGMHRSIEPGVVEGVQRLAQFEHHVIGDVDQRRDGADAAALEAPLHPVRRWRPGIDALEDAAEIERTGSRRIESDGTLIGDGGRNVGNLRQRGRGAGYGRNLTGDSGQRQAVGAVRRQLQRKQAVVKIEILTDRLPDRRIGRQNQEARGVFGDPQFPGRTEHARRLDAAHPGDLDHEIAGQLRARQGARHALADGDVRRAADDGRRLAAARIDPADIQAVGIRMTRHLQHLGDDDIVELRGDLVEFLDLEAGHGQLMGEFLARQFGIDEGSQPGFGEFHANCLRKRRSPSKNRRRSLTP